MEITTQNSTCLANLEALRNEVATERTRLSFFLELAHKLNSEFLEKNDALEILKAVLVGVTAGEGLGFNRAYWFSLNGASKTLNGDLAIGPWDAQEAALIWEGLKRRPRTLFEMLKDVAGHFEDSSRPLSRIVKTIKISMDQEDHFLVQALRDGLPTIIHHIPEGTFWPLESVPIAVAPVATGPHKYGVIVCDNHILKTPIDEKAMEFLVLFTTISSMAFTKAKMCSLLKAKISELEKLNRELATSRKKLVHVEKTAELGRIADKVLHEIKNPLSAVGGLARLLVKRSEDEGTKTIASKIVEGAKKIECTIDTLFSFDEGPHLELKRVRVRPILEMIYKVIAIDLEEKGIEGHFSMNVDDGLYLDLDVGHFQQAVYHLIHNAIKTMDRGGMLIVTVRPLAMGIEMEIADSGTMLLRELGPTRGQSKGGPRAVLSLGLGLSLAKQIIELHGGTFIISRNKMGGNTVRITIPKAK